MKPGQFTDEQIRKYANVIVAILQEAQRGGKPIIELCKEKGITETTFYSWRKKFGGMPDKT